MLFWKQHVALFVNEPTRLPLFVPLAPARTVTTRLTETAASFVVAVLGMGYQAEATSDMWRRTLSFFDRHLASPGG